MLLLRTVYPWLLLAFLGLQVSLSSGAHLADKLSRRAQRSGSKGGGTGKGKFSTKDKMQCVWSAREVGENVKLSVKCENPEARIRGGTTDLSCEYNARPQSCQGYNANPSGFWKQVGRAFKKLQGKVCREGRALVKAGMCKNAPRDAHFKLDMSSSVASSQSGDPETAPPLPPRPTSSTTGTTLCTKRADHRETSKEYCGGSWASVCSFFFSMLQSEDC
ncbi:fibroblast growth factor-binding protein 1-like [Mugil cephalus]|uniref:fibroblast growth factor-binding protein 1-like n=1 Tax=Mugil cephalus TaxID=48193 RepID=UPI001FB66793|nr:fibroblast growth factor-binding protein 1-like [Mugil cephalus]